MLIPNLVSCSLLIKINTQEHLRLFDEDTINDFLNANIEVEEFNLLDEISEIVENSEFNKCNETLNKCDETLNKCDETLNKCDETLNKCDDIENINNNSKSLSHCLINSDDEDEFLPHVRPSTILKCTFNRKPITKNKLKIRRKNIKSKQKLSKSIEQLKRWGFEIHNS